MAKLSHDDVLKLAKLAKLHLSDEEVNKFQVEISTILTYVEQLQEIDVAGLEPTHQITGLKNITRPDVVKDYGASPESLLENSPAKSDGYIKVRRILT